MSTELDNDGWTDEMVADALRVVSGAGHQARLMGLCDLVGQQVGKTGKAVYRRIVWGLGTGYNRYRRSTAAHNPLAAVYGDATYFELELMRYSLDTRSAGVHKRTDEEEATRLAEIMCRPVDWTLALYRNCRPGSNIAGFGLIPKS